MIYIYGTNKITNKLSKEFDVPHDEFRRVDYSEMNSTHFKGIYAISVDDPHDFNEFYSLPHHQEIIDHIKSVPLRSNLIYIGSAKKGNSTISQRLFEYQLGGLYLKSRNPSTFRAIFYRKLGSVLGFEAVVPQKNFVFDLDDNTKIRTWIINHLRVKYSKEDKNLIIQVEKSLIADFRPPFNYKHNPVKCKPITDLYRMNS